MIEKTCTLLQRSPYLTKFLVDHPKFEGVVDLMLIVTYY